MVKIVRKFEFDAGHRVYGHQGKCRYPHGHRYVLHLHLSCDVLSDLGMVMDFGTVKQAVGTWLNDTLDHGFIAYSGDLEMLEALMNLEECKLIVVDGNPTAEFLVEWMVPELQACLDECSGGRMVVIEKAELHETPNCSAVWTRGEAWQRSTE